MENLISQYQFLCRICTNCLNEDVNFKKIFEENINNTSLIDMMLAVSSVAILPNDNLPDKICTHCLDSLKLCYEFQNLCRESDRKLKLKLEQVLSENTKKENWLESEYPKETTRIDDVPIIPDTNFEIILFKSEDVVDAEQSESLSDEEEQNDQSSSDTDNEEKEDEDSTCAEQEENNRVESDENSIITENISREFQRKSNKILSCPFCPKRFDRSYNFKRHLNSVHKTKAFVCKTCKDVFTNKSDFEEHRKIHNKTGDPSEAKYECPECGKKFRKKESIPGHTKMHRIPHSKYKCEICSKIFTRFSTLTKHKKLHDQVHKCEICKEIFQSKPELVIHVRLNHGGIKPFTCSICDKGFFEASTLEEHIRGHSKNTSNLCSECGRTFTSKSHLRQHLIRHSGIKPYECPECPKKFSFKSGLNFHMPTHTKVKPYTCEICGSSFTRSYSLVTHHRIHTGERPYGCEVCPMRFNSSDHLKRHLRTHTGEKPFVCKYCPQAFTQKHYLVKHISMHLGKKSYPCKECAASFEFSAELKSHISLEHYKKPKILQTNEETFISVATTETQTSEFDDASNQFY